MQGQWKAEGEQKSEANNYNSTHMHGIFRTKYLIDFVTWPPFIMIDATKRLLSDKANQIRSCENTMQL